MHDERVGVDFDTIWTPGPDTILTKRKINPTSTCDERAFSCAVSLALDFINVRMCALVESQRLDAGD